MLTLRTSGPRKGEYYLQCAAEYYEPSLPGETPGYWIETHAATVAGLVGKVKKADFRRACNGFAKDRSKMRQNAGRKKKVQAFSDLTVSDPKGLSVVERLADDHVKKV